MKKTLIALAFVAVVAGCAAYSQAFAAKSSDEREAFHRCRFILMQRQCGTSGAESPSMGQLMCLDALADSFGNAPDGRNWLIRNGCPSEMVD